MGQWLTVPNMEDDSQPSSLSPFPATKRETNSVMGQNKEEIVSKKKHADKKQNKDETLPTTRLALKNNIN